MKTKLYILALLALLTCGLSFALPSVRHAASALLSSVLNTSVLAKPSPLPAAIAKGKDISSITITPISTGADGERCAVLTVPGLQLTIPANDYTCKVRVSWYLAEADRVADTALIRTAGAYPTDVSPVSETAGSALAQTGEIIDELSPPTLNSRRFTYKLQSKATFNGAGVASGTVAVFDHVETVPVFYDPVTMIYDPLYIGPFYDGCGVPGIGSAPLGSTSPGRWVSYGNAGRKFPGTSYDFEFKAATQSNPKQVRATWYTFDNLHRPIWLQTEWMSDTGAAMYAHGMSFQGELRRYRWNPKANLRSGGKRVGYIVGQLLKPGEFGVRIKVRRIWLEPGVTDQLPEVFPDGKLDDSECLQKSNYSAISKSANINDAYSGVWSLTSQEHNAETDSAIFDGKFEYHMWRLWDQSGAPIWLHAAGGSHLQTVFPDNLTLPVGYVRSPFINGLPQNDAVTGEPACGPANCNLCQVSVGTMTRWHNVIPPNVATQLPFILARYKLNLHAQSGMPAPAECSVHNYFGGSGMANPAISWDRPRASSLYDIDIVDGYSRFDAPPGITASVVASPLESIKTSVGQSSQFEIAWAFNKVKTRRLMRRKQVGSAILVLNNLAQVGTFSDQIYDRATTPMTVPFEAGRYEYFVEFLDANTGVYSVEIDARAAPVYVVNPAPPPQPPQCLNIIPAPSAGAPIVGSCVRDYPYPDVSVLPSTPMEAIFPNVNAYEYRIREEIVLGGTPQQAGCNSNSPGVYYTSGALQRIPFNACTTPGEYLYRIMACSLDGGCGPGFPTEGIRVLVGGAQTLDAPTNVTAIAEGPALGYRVSWTPPASAQTLTYTIARRALSSPPAASPSPAPPGTGPTDQTSTSTTVTGTETNNGTYYFWVKGCAGALCSQWSQPSSGLVLPVAPVGADWDNLTPAQAPVPTNVTDIASPAAAVEVGATTGNFRVDESGNSTYDIPLYVAPSAGGVAPSMSLSYSSGASDGQMGVGFNLSGGSAITRCRKTVENGDGPGPHNTVQFTEADVFCLDGQRLIVVGNIAGEGTVYRSEVDSLSNIVAYTEAGVTGGPAYWSVWGKDGLQRLYGLSGATHPKANCVALDGGLNNCNGRVMRNSQVGGSWATANEVVSWSISKIRSRDPAGGAIEFSYVIDSTSAESTLTRVTYSGADSGVRPSASLRFFYRNRMNPTTNFMSGMRLVTSKLLERVDSYNADGALARKYSMTYEEQSVSTGNSSGSGRPRLTSVQEYAGNGSRYPATQLDWTSNAIGYVERRFGPGQTPAGQEEHMFRKMRSYKYGDVNGDGRTDIVWLFGQETSGGEITVSLNNVRDLYSIPTYPFGKTRTSISFPNERGDADRGYQVFDFNQDGLDDLLIAQFNPDLVSGQWRVFLSNGTTFNTTPVPLATMSFAGSSEETEALTDASMADFNGDGLVDFLVPAKVNGEWKYQLRTMQRNAAVVCATPSNPGQICPYIFSAPQNIDIGSGAVVVPRSATENMEAMDFNGDGLSDLRLFLPSSRVASGITFGNYAPLDIGCDFYLNPARNTDNLPVPPECVAQLQRSASLGAGAWVMFTNRGLQNGVVTFERFEAFDLSEVRYGDKHFIATDVNADGLTDVVYETSPTVMQSDSTYRDGSWAVRLNLGQTALGVSKFSERICVHRVGAVCARIYGWAGVTLQDYNQDGRLDFWVAQGGWATNASDPSNVDLCPGMGTQNLQPYGILLGGDKGFNGGKVCQTQVTGQGDDWTRAQVDLDGDGQVDVWGTDNPFNNSTPSRRFHFVALNANRYVANDLIREIRNGLGAVTAIDYAPLTFSSVYRRDYSAPFMTDAGRGSPMFDLAVPQYVVQQVTSSAPNVENVGVATASVAYRYAGMKMQGNGRGGLGMRKVFSRDLQTNIETETEYFQSWPLTGRPKQTISRSYGSASSNLNACRTSGENDGDLVTCMVRRPICAAGQAANCDDTLAGTPLLLSEGTDTWGYKLRTGLSSIAAGALPAAPASVFVYQVASVKKTHYPNTADNSAPLLKTERTVFEGVDSAGVVQAGFDGNGNLLSSSTAVFDAGAVLRQIQQSTMTYTNGALATVWVPGLVSETTVATKRGALLRTRKSRFEYEDYGSVKVERIQPEDASLALNTFHVRNSYGQELAKVTCDSSYTDAACTNWGDQFDTKIPQGVIADPSNPNRIRRYQASVYDATQRFVNKSYAPLDSAIGADSAATPTLTSNVTERNLYGDVTRGNDANGVQMRSQYTAMGRAYHSYTPGSGTSTVTRVDWCIVPMGETVSTVSCPTGAVYRTEVTTLGAPTQRSYHDLLGRVMMTEAQSFEANLWTNTSAGFDRLGRTIETTEPYFSTGAGNDLRRCGGTICTRTSYDDFGRITLMIHADDVATRPVRTTTQHGLSACSVMGTASSCVKEMIVDPIFHNTIKFTSVLAEVVQSQDHLGTSINFEHDPHRNVTKVTQNGLVNNQIQQIVTSAVFDDLGRRTSMTEPNSGARTTSYNAAGEAILERDANSQCTSNRFDVMGRLVARADYKSNDCASNLESQASWQYDLSPNGKGKVSSETDSASQLSRTSSYDSLGRPYAVVQTIEGKTYRQETTFDQHARVFQSFDLILAAGDAGAISNTLERKVGVQNIYNAQGFQSRIVSAQNTSDVFYEILSTNARGQILTDRRGNKVELMRSMSFDGATGRLLGMQSGINGAIQNLDYGLNNAAAGYDVLGNLQFRKDLRAGLTESFVYDDLNRITGSNVVGTAGLNANTSFSYDAFGNFIIKGNQTHKTGSYTGVTQSCARSAIGPNMLAASVVAGTSTVYCYDFNGNQISAGIGGTPGRQISYAVHDKPLTVRTFGSTNSYTEYSYGPGREIVARREGVSVTSQDRYTHYVGGMEVTYRANAGAVTERREFRRYLANFLVITMNIERNGSSVVKSSTRRYRFEEKLGSLDVLTDALGTVVQRMSFDVWGQRRSASWGTWNSSEVANFDNKETRKGYTGHEMLDAANLIHMGGRMYDPLVGKFLSADILVQAPFNTQSHNRYSYVMNNPMNYTDPSGYAWIDSNWRSVVSIAMNFFLPGSGLVGVANGLLAKVITGMISGAVQTGSLKGALTGGLGAAMFHGIGQKFSEMAEANVGKSGLVGGTASYAGKGGLTGGQFAAKVAAHAAAGGVMSVLNGGKFGHGFVSAGFVEAVNPALAGMSKPAQAAASIVVGGTSSVLAGGKFANGAVTASFQLAFNHLGEKPETHDEMMKRINEMCKGGSCWMASGAQLGMPIDDTLSEPVNRALQSCQNFALFSYGISFIPFVGAGFTFWRGDATTIDWASASAYNTGFVANYGYNTLVAKNAQRTATIKASITSGTAAKQRALKIMTIEQDLAKSSLSGLKSFGKVLGPVGIVLSTIDFGIEMASCEKNYAGK